MAINLTGTWNNLGPDGGVYKLLQVGSVLFWRGTHKEKGWSNVGYGTVDEPHRQVSVSWGDPDGGNAGNYGYLFFEIVDGNNLKKVAGRGGGDFRRG